MTQTKKLNIFQRGIFQKAVTIAVYFASFAAGGFLLDWLEKRRFLVIAGKAQQQGLVSQENIPSLKALITDMDGTAIFFIILVGAFCAFIAWLLMRWAANLNWSWPVTLPKAMGFRSAMCKLGVVEPLDQIEFVRKHKLPVFIALSPLLTEEGENVRAKLYAFAHHEFSENDIFSRHTGRQTLCLDAEDYERFLSEGKIRSSLAESVALAEKNVEIKNLRISLATLTQEHEALTKERDELRGKVRVQPAQEDARVDRLRVERLLWAAYTPVLDRLMRDAPAGKQYTTPEIEAAFKAEWEQRADLRQHLLHLTESEEAAPSETILKAIKAEFKDAGKLSPGGRPRKNP